MARFQYAHSSEKVPGDGTQLPAEFRVTAPSSTDIWSKPPSTRRFDAPILYQSIPLSKFKRARVAVSAAWTSEYDQGGLIIVLNPADEQKRRWIKTGIEFMRGKAHLSTVAKDRWADWSLLPIPSGGCGATLEIVKEEDGSLWIYFVEGVQKSPIREVTWAAEDDGSEICWVGVYAAKPSKEGDDLVVKFGHLIIDSDE